MVTQTNTSGSNPITPTTSFVERPIWYLIAGGILLLALISVAILTALPASGTSTMEIRAMQAWSARYQGLADQFEQANSQRAMDAWAARNQGLADLFLGGSSQQRALDAWAARYQGLADLFLGGSSQQRALDAWSARYQGLADQFEQANSQRAMDAWAARNQGLAEFYNAEK